MSHTAPPPLLPALPSGPTAQDVGYNPNHDITSWDDFFDAIYTVFEVSTLENWSSIMYMAMDAEGDYASLYFVATIVFCTFLVLNLAVSIICAVYSREWAAHEARLAEKADRKYQKKCGAARARAGRPTPLTCATRRRSLNRQLHDLAAEGLPDFDPDGDGLPASLQRADAASESTLIQRGLAHPQSMRLAPLAPNASMPAMDLRGTAWSPSPGSSPARSPSADGSPFPPYPGPRLSPTPSSGSGCELDTAAPPRSRRRSVARSRNDRELGRRISLAAARDVAQFIEGGEGLGSVEVLGYGGKATQPAPATGATARHRDAHRSMPLSAGRQAPVLAPAGSPAGARAGGGGARPLGVARASARLRPSTPTRAPGRWTASTRFASPVDPDNPWAARTLTQASLAPVRGDDPLSRGGSGQATTASDEESPSWPGQGPDSSDGDGESSFSDVRRPRSRWLAPLGRAKAQPVASTRWRVPPAVELTHVPGERVRAPSGRVVSRDLNFQAHSVCSDEGEEEEEEEGSGREEKYTRGGAGGGEEAQGSDRVGSTALGPYTSAPVERVKEARRRSMRLQKGTVAAAAAAAGDQPRFPLLPPPPDSKEFPRAKPPQWLWRTVVVIIMVQTALLFPDTRTLAPLAARLVLAGQCATTAALVGEFAFRCTLVRFFMGGMLRVPTAMFEAVLVVAQVGFLAVVVFVFEGGSVPLRAVDTVLPTVAVQGLRVAMAAQFLRVIYLVPAIRTMLLIAFGTAHSITSLFALVLVLLVMLSVFMMQLFYKRLPDEGFSARINFDSFGRALLSLFIVFAGDDWNVVYYACWRAGGMAWIVTPVFIIGWYLLANSVLLNVFIAVILGNFQVAEEMREEYQNYLYRMELTRSIQQWEEEELAQGADDDEPSGGAGHQGAHTFRPDAGAVSAAAADIGAVSRTRAPSSVGALAQPGKEQTFVARARAAVSAALARVGLGQVVEEDLGTSIQAYAQAVHTPSESGSGVHSGGSTASTASPQGTGSGMGPLQGGAEFPNALALQVVKARMAEKVKAEDEALEAEEAAAAKPSAGVPAGGTARGRDGGQTGNDELDASLGDEAYSHDSAHSLASRASRNSVAARLSWLGLRGRERAMTGAATAEAAAKAEGRERGGAVWRHGAAEVEGEGEAEAAPAAGSGQRGEARAARRRLRRVSVAVAKSPAFALMAQKSAVWEPDELGEGDEEAGWGQGQRAPTAPHPASSSSSSSASGSVAKPQMERQRNLRARGLGAVSAHSSGRSLGSQDSGAASVSAAHAAQAARIHVAAMAARDERTQAKVRQLAPEVAAAERDGPSWWAWAWERGRQALRRRAPEGLAPAVSLHGWMDLGHPVRRAARTVTASWAFRAAVALSILASCGFLALERHENKADPVFRTADVVFLGAFAAEFATRALAHGLWGQPQAYLRNPWNRLDAVVLATMAVNVAASVEYRSTLSWWERGLRVTRTLRALRLIRYNSTMRLLCSSLVIGARHIALAAVAFFAAYLFFSVLGYEMFRGRFGRCNVPSVPDRASCVGVHTVDGEAVEAQWTVPAANFDTLGRSMQTMFQVATVEGYIDVMGHAMDATGVDQQPRMDASFHNAIFFVVYISVVSFVALQLFTGVILDSIVRSTGRHMWTQQQRQWKYMAKLIHASKPQYQRESLDPRQRRLVWLRQACVDVCIHCNHNRNECPRRWHHLHSRFDKLVLVLILLNALLMCLRHNPMSPEFERFMTLSSHAFLGAFTLEMGIKLIAYGPRGYWHDIANVFDGVLVLGALSLLVVDMSGVALGAQLARIFRIGRLVRVIRGSPSLRVLFQTLYASLPSLLNVTLLLILVFFVYAVAGMEMYGSLGLPGTEPPPSELETITQHANFHSLGNALLTLFRITTGEDWQGIMFDCERKSPNASPIYFISFYVLGVFIFLNFYLGSILENFEYCYGVNQGSMDLQDLSIFRRTWAHFDPKARGALPLSCLEDFLIRLTLPRKNPDAYALQEDADREDSAINVRARELTVIQRAQQLAASRKNVDGQSLRRHERRQRARVLGTDADGKALAEADRRDPLRRVQRRQETAQGLEQRWQNGWGSRRNVRPPQEKGRAGDRERTCSRRLPGVLPAWLLRCCGCGSSEPSSPSPDVSSRRRKLFQVTSDFEPTPFQRYIRESLLDRRWVRLLKLEMRVMERASGRDGRQCRYGALLMALARRRFGPKALPVEERVRAEFEFRFLETLDGVLRVQALVRGRIMRRRLHKEREGARRAARLNPTTSYWHARSGRSQLNALALPHVQRALARRNPPAVSVLPTIEDGAEGGDGAGGATATETRSVKRTTARERLGPPPAVPLPTPPTPQPPAPGADGPTRQRDNPFHNPAVPAAAGSGAGGHARAGSHDDEGTLSRHNVGLRDTAAPWARTGPRRVRERPPAGGARLPRGK